MDNMFTTTCLTPSVFKEFEQSRTTHCLQMFINSVWPSNDKYNQLIVNNLLRCAIKFKLTFVNSKRCQRKYNVKGNQLTDSRCYNLATTKIITLMEN